MLRLTNVLFISIYLENKMKKNLPVMLITSDNLDQSELMSMERRGGTRCGELLNIDDYILLSALKLGTQVYNTTKDENTMVRMMKELFFQAEYLNIKFQNVEYLPSKGLILYFQNLPYHNEAQLIIRPIKQINTETFTKKIVSWEVVDRRDVLPRQPVNR